jgi:hypothetical protein
MPDERPLELDQLHLLAVQFTHDLRWVHRSRETYQRSAAGTFSCLRCAIAPDALALVEQPVSAPDRPARVNLTSGPGACYRAGGASAGDPPTIASRNLLFGRQLRRSRWERWLAGTVLAWKKGDPAGPEEGGHSFWSPEVPLRPPGSTRKGDQTVSPRQAPSPTPVNEPPPATCLPPGRWPSSFLDRPPERKSHGGCRRGTARRLRPGLDHRVHRADQGRGPA